MPPASAAASPDLRTGLKGNGAVSDEECAPSQTKESTVLNHESIRNASFSLMPTGYNPEEVDAALNAVAERLGENEAIDDLVTAPSFAVTDVGYAQPEVDAFFAELAGAAGAADSEAIPAQPADEQAIEEDRQAVDEPQADDSADQDTAGAQPDEATPVEQPDLEADEEPSADEASDEPELDTSMSYDADEAFDDSGDADEEIEPIYVEAPTPVEWHAPTTGELDLSVLGEAVDRTAETLGSLRSFIDNEIAAMQLAVERQAQETAKRCEQLLHQATTEANALTESVNAEIGRARKAADRQAEKERRELAKELKQARAECDADVKAARAAADEYAAKVRAEADRDRAEAQRTIENAISMQSSIAESLERARQQLTPARESGADELAA
jgi:DivIVA domain-containing protein